MIRHVAFEKLSGAAAFPDAVHREVHRGIGILRAKSILQIGIETGSPTDAEDQSVKTNRHPLHGRRFGLVVLLPERWELGSEVLVRDHCRLAGGCTDDRAAAFAVNRSIDGNLHVVVVDTATIGDGNIPQVSIDMTHDNRKTYMYLMYT